MRSPALWCGPVAATCRSSGPSGARCRSGPVSSSPCHPGSDRRRPRALPSGPPRRPPVPGRVSQQRIWCGTGLPGRPNLPTPVPSPSREKVPQSTRVAAGRRPTPSEVRPPTFHRLTSCPLATSIQRTVVVLAGGVPGSCRPDWRRRAGYWAELAEQAGRGLDRRPERRAPPGTAGCGRGTAREDSTPASSTHRRPTAAIRTPILPWIAALPGPGRSPARPPADDEQGGLLKSRRLERQRRSQSGQGERVGLAPAVPGQPLT